jgi:hypothetical protein
VTRIDSVRAATTTARQGVRHAAEVMAPYAGTAKEQATQFAGQAADYAQDARDRLAPKVAETARQARVTARAQYSDHLAAHVDQALTHVPPRAAELTRKAGKQAGRAARQAADYTAETVENARQAAGPVREEAAARSAAALAALRSRVTAADIEKLSRRRTRRARTGRVVKRVALLGALSGGAFAAWKWWQRQANPDWLVEPPAATELTDLSTEHAGNPGRPVTAVNGSTAATSDLDPEVQAKQAEEEAAGSAEDPEGRR